METPPHPTPEEMSLPRLLSALSDPLRLGIVRLLSDGGERAWGDLRAPVAKSTLSHHLKVLRDAGLTHTRQEGTRCFVRLRVEELDDRFPDVLPALLAAANEDDIGDQVGEAAAPDDSRT